MWKHGFLTAATAFGVIGGFWLIGSLPSRAVDSQSQPVLTEWYYADGIIQPEGITKEECMKGVWAPTAEWMVISNLSSKETTVKATFYFEEMPPRQMSQKIPAHASGHLVVHNHPEVVLPKKLYGVCVQGDTPFLVQPCRAEYEPNNPVTAAMAAFIAHPGPLGKKETRWVYADGLVLTSEGPLEEWEWITILNPNPGQDAHIKIFFNFVGQQKTHTLTVPAERVRTVDLFNLPVFLKNSLCQPIIESDVPVVVEQVRRCYAKGIPVIQSMYACMALPIGDQRIE
jgi:hypothetical protein